MIQSWEKKMLSIHKKPFIKFKVHVATCNALQTVLKLKQESKNQITFHKLTALEHNLYILLKFLES